MKSWTWFSLFLAVAIAASGQAWAQSGAAMPPVAGQQAPTYGPLKFNVSGGGDFYIYQDGAFVQSSINDGIIEFHLKNDPLEIGYNGEQLNICLATIRFDEVKVDPHGYEASCLSGPMTGARPPNSDALLVYAGKEWSDGNTELSDSTSKKARPLAGYSFSYKINSLIFVDAPDTKLADFKGTLYGYIAVYRGDIRTNSDIMPIRLVFE